MNPSRYIILLLVLFNAACSSAQSDHFPVGKVIEKVTCLSDTLESYAVYIPAKGNKIPLPVVYFFDPHASGSLPLRKYQALADVYNFILIGSNTSKNGNDWQYTEDIWRIMSEDARKRLNIDPQRVYAAGFSGGAKVAGYLALRHPEIKGVLAMGAGLPDGAPAGNYPFSFTAIAGEGDMNMTELVAINAAFDGTTTRHRIMLFNGKHEWAPSAIIDRAFAGLQFDAMFNKLMPVDEKLIDGFKTSNKRLVEEHNKQKDLVKAVAVCTLTMNMLQGISSDVGWFEKEAASIVNQNDYKLQLQARQQLLQTEQQIKAQYMQQFQQGDLNYWKKTIGELNVKAKASTAAGGMNQRLLAYLSLAFYSISNQQIRNNQNEAAQHFVDLYKLADPTNSEAWYFSAILHARKNEKEAAENDLLQATKCGFKEKERIHQQTEFQQMKLDFVKIESAINQETER